MRRVVLLAAPMAAVALLATACGSSNTPTTTSSGSAASSSGAASSVLTDAQKALDEASKVPAVGSLTPVTLPSGTKTIGYLSCGQAAPACAQMAAAAQKAVEAAGYKFILADGKLSPQGWTDGDLSLINQKVDIIINQVAADALVKPALAAAKAAGIPIVCQICANAATPVEGGSSANVDADTYLQGVLAADAMIVETQGKAQIAIQTNTTSPNVTARDKGITDEFAKCASLGCKIVASQEVGQNGDLTANGRNLANTFLQQFPKGQLDYIVPPSDSQSLGVQQAISTSGRTEVHIAGFDAGDPNLGWIRDGTFQTFDLATPLVYSSWAAVDQAIRILAGQKGADLKLPSQFINKANVPAAGAPVETTDFASAYKAAWGK